MKSDCLAEAGDGGEQVCSRTGALARELDQAGEVAGLNTVGPSDRAARNTIRAVIEYAASGNQELYLAEYASRRHEGLSVVTEYGTRSVYDRGGVGGKGPRVG